MGGLEAALALWAAVRPRTLELAASTASKQLGRLAGLTAALGPYFAPLADAALATRDPDRCARLRTTIEMWGCRSCSLQARAQTQQSAALTVVGAAP